MTLLLLASWLVLGAGPESPAVRIDIPADAPVRGPRYAKVTVVEWADFQCPFSAQAQSTLAELRKIYGNDLRLVFRHQPLGFHRDARLASEAAMAAQAQGRFWEMHDALFANFGALDLASIEKYARDLGLDMEAFDRALVEDTFGDRVDADAELGRIAGASGTPTFFINGRRQDGAASLATFRKIIDAELANAQAVLATGVPLSRLYEHLQQEAVVRLKPTVRLSSVVAERFPNVVDVNTAGAPHRGPDNAPVTLVEFADFQCPFTAQAQRVLTALMKEYPTQLRLVFKHQPLSFHPGAKRVALAARAAQDQDRFWQFHDQLFLAFPQSDDIDRAARLAGLEPIRFRSDLESARTDAAIEADMAEAQRVGATGTPTFFINGRRVVGAQPIELFRMIIDYELKKASK